MYGCPQRGYADVRDGRVRPRPGGLVGQVPRPVVVRRKGEVRDPMRRELNAGVVHVPNGV